MEQTTEINDYSKTDTYALIRDVTFQHANRQEKLNELWVSFLNNTIQPYQLHHAMCIVNDTNILLPVKFIHDDIIEIKICFFKHIFDHAGRQPVTYYSGCKEEKDKNFMNIFYEIRNIDLKDLTYEHDFCIPKRILSNIVKLMLATGGDTSVGLQIAYIATYFLDVPNSLVQNILEKYRRSPPGCNDHIYKLEINEILAVHQPLKLVADTEKLSLLTEEQLHNLIPTLDSQDLLLLFANTANIRFKLFDRVRDTLRDLIVYHRGSLPTEVLSLTQYKMQKLIPYNLLTQVESIYILELIRNGICEQAHVQLLKNLNEKCIDLEAKDRKAILLPIAAYVNSLDTDIHYTEEVLIDMIIQPFQLNKLYETSAVTLDKMSEMAVRAGEHITDTDCLKQYLEAVKTYMQDEGTQDIKLTTEAYNIQIKGDLYNIHLPRIASCQNELKSFLNSINFMQHDIAINAVNLLRNIQHNTQEYNTKIDDKVKFLSYLQDNPEEIQVKTEIQAMCNNQPLPYIMEKLREYTSNSSTATLNNAIREVKAEPKEILKCQWLLKAIWQDYFSDEQRKLMLESKHFCKFFKIVMNLGMEFEDKLNFYDKYANHENGLADAPRWFCTRMAADSFRSFLGQSAGLINHIGVQNGLVVIAYQISEKAEATRVHNNARLEQLNSVIAQANSRLVFFNNSLIMAKKPHAQENRIIQSKTGACRIISLRCLSDDDIMEYLSSTTHLTLADIAQIKMSVNESSQELIKIITNNPGLNNQAILNKFIDVIEAPAAVTNSHNFDL